MFLGLDLGTTNVKALVADARGTISARGSAPVETAHVGERGVEQDIEQIYQATVAAISQVTAECDAAAIRAVGVSTQGGAMQILDAAGDPHGPVISWLDRRGAPWDEKLNAELGREWFAERIGHAGSALCTGQLLRLAEQGELPEKFAVAFVGDQIVRRLTGRAAHDATSLALTMLYNPTLGKADPDVLAHVGIDESQLPDLLGPRTPAGLLTEQAAAETHLPAGIPVGPAVHDQYASALAAGIGKPGDVMVGTGTAWVLLAVSPALPRPLGGDAFCCTHVIDGLFGQILSLRNGGSSVAWALDMLGKPDATGAQIDEMLAAAPPGADGLLFLPFLASPGERLPADTAGALTGLTLGHRPEHVLRAVVEGLACELARYLQLLDEQGTGARHLTLCGSAAGSSVTPHIIADVTDLPVTCLLEPDTSTLGAAVLARSLTEPDAPLHELASQMMPDIHPVPPAVDRGGSGGLFERYTMAVGMGI